MKMKIQFDVIRNGIGWSDTVSSFSTREKAEAELRQRNFSKEKDDLDFTIQETPICEKCKQVEGNCDCDAEI